MKKKAKIESGARMVSSHSIFPADRKKIWLEMLSVAFLSAAYLLIYYRPIFSSGFDKLIGAEDATLNMLLASSWKDFFSGALPMGELRSFFPMQGMRAGTDLNLSLYLLGLPLEWMGLDEYHAYTVVYLLLHWLCMAGTYGLCRRCFHFSRVSSVIGVVLFACSNSFRVKLCHTQFYFLLLLPVFACFMTGYFRHYHFRQRLARWMHGLGALVVFAVIAYGNFYSAFFIAFFLMLCFLVACCMKTGRSFAMCWWRSHCMEVVLLGLCGIMLMTPFLICYMPGIFLPGWDWKTIMGGIPTWYEIMKPSAQNWLWGGLLLAIRPGIGLNECEHYYGLPVITFMFSVCAFAYYAVKCRKEKFPIQMRILAMAIPLVWILSLKIGSFTLWRLVACCVPGASAVRALSRIHVFLCFPLALFSVAVLERFLRDLNGKHETRWFVWCLAAFLLVDNINLSPVSRWSRRERLAQINAVPPPPAQAKLFVINFEQRMGRRPEMSSGEGHAWPKYGLLAMEIAQKYHMFTFNGYTGKVLGDSWLFYHPDRKYYAPYIDEWIRMNKIKIPVYDYDPDLRTWRLHRGCMIK